jgi:predicted amidophosphoribosyltransferase
VSRESLPYCYTCIRNKRVPAHSASSLCWVYQQSANAVFTLNISNQVAHAFIDVLAFHQRPELERLLPRALATASQADAESTQLAEGPTFSNSPAIVFVLQNMAQTCLGHCQEI